MARSPRPIRVAPLAPGAAHTIRLPDARIRFLDASGQATNNLRFAEWNQAFLVKDHLLGHPWSDYELSNGIDNWGENPDTNFVAGDACGSRERSSWSPSTRSLRFTHLHTAIDRLSP